MDNVVLWPLVELPKWTEGNVGVARWLGGYAVDQSELASIDKQAPRYRYQMGKEPDEKEKVNVNA